MLIIFSQETLILSPNSMCEQHVVCDRTTPPLPMFAAKVLARGRLAPFASLYLIWSQFVTFTLQNIDRIRPKVLWIMEDGTMDHIQRTSLKSMTTDFLCKLGADLMQQAEIFGYPSPPHIYYEKSLDTNLASNQLSSMRLCYNQGWFQALN